MNEILLYINKYINVLVYKTIDWHKNIGFFFHKNIKKHEMQKSLRNFVTWKTMKSESYYFDYLHIWYKSMYRLKYYISYKIYNN